MLNSNDRLDFKATSNGLNGWWYYYITRKRNSTKLISLSHKETCVCVYMCTQRCIVIKVVINYSFIFLDMYLAINSHSWNIFLNLTNYLFVWNPVIYTTETYSSISTFLCFVTIWKLKRVWKTKNSIKVHFVRIVETISLKII